jgi:NitT/TauT family transport system ATP-binding protein
LTAGPVTADKDAYVAVSKVGKVFETKRGSVAALADVSFGVAEGEFVAILGPSGCGKSTLLMICGGLESASSGQVAISGSDVTGPRDSIGIMFQDPTLLPWMTVLDNVLFPIHILRRPERDYLERAQQLIEIAGLGGFERSKPHQLSGGMRQRVSICRALVYDPAILLMDEPFSALDALTRDEMNVALLDIWERNRKTVLFVTHSIREAVLLGDRVIVMSRRPGTIIEDLRIPFTRPRDFALGRTAEFNDICEHLRSLIGRSVIGREQRVPQARA